MTFNKSIFVTLALAVVTVISFSSCKKCVVPEEDVYVGSSIQEEAIIYPKIGYISEQMNGDFHINGNSPFASEFEVDLGNGVKVEYSSISSGYDIVGLPMTVNCKAQFTRELQLNAAQQAATYKVDAVTCESCETLRIIENWVLVEKIPAGLTVYFDGNIIKN